MAAKAKVTNEIVGTSIIADYSRWKAEPTVKTVHIHATSEILGMQSTIRHDKCDIYEATDSSGQLLLVTKTLSKDGTRRKLVLSQANYKIYELL